MVGIAMMLSAGCSQERPTQVDSGRNVVHGRAVSGYGIPMQGVEVTLAGRFGRRETVTDQTGMFRFEKLPDGIGTLTTVSGGDTTRDLVELDRVRPTGLVVRMPRFELAWSDEFDSSALDRSTWFPWTVRSFELGDYRPEQVSVADGMVRLRTDGSTGPDGRYPTAGITSIPTFSYGRIEVRARLPVGKGLWSAHWFYNVDSLEPYFEVDIMENLGHDPHRIHFHNHYKSSIARMASTGDSWFGDEMGEGFHTFRLDWYVGLLEWYVDDVLRHRSVTFVPEREAILHLNTAVGGSWPGAPNAQTRFPQFHDIDYVRVWRLER